jgi:hypothetical protein
MILPHYGLSQPLSAGRPFNIAKEVAMTPENFVRFSGLVLMLGGLSATLAWILFVIFDPEHVQTTGRQWMVLNFMAIFGGIFMAMGLPGLYLAMSERVGTIAWLGLAIMFVGIVIPYVAVQAVETTTSPNVPAGMRTLVSIGAPSLFVGSLITGALLYTYGVYPKWVAVGLIIAVLLGLLAVVRPLPAVLARGGLFPAIYTAFIMIIGYFTYTQGR